MSINHLVGVAHPTLCHNLYFPPLKSDPRRPFSSPVVCILRYVNISQSMTQFFVQMCAVVHAVGYMKKCPLTADPTSGFDLVVFLKTTETQFTGLKSSTPEACGLWLCVLVLRFDG